jgi:hypothetical protein
MRLANANKIDRKSGESPIAAKLRTKYWGSPVISGEFAIRYLLDIAGDRTMSATAIMRSSRKP